PDEAEEPAPGSSSLGTTQQQLAERSGPLRKNLFRQSQHRPAADACQPSLGPRGRCQARLRPGVDMIDIASGRATMTHKSDFWHNRCVNHHYLLIYTQGTSEGLGFATSQMGNLQEGGNVIMKFAHFAHVWNKAGMTPAQRYQQLWRELQVADELGFD